MVWERLVTYSVTRLSELMEALSLEPRRISSHDRSILEQVILPYFGTNPSYHKVLFVGCSAYTQWYENFFANQEYWTIDSKHIKRKYGSKRHITDSLTNLENHFPHDYFNLIIMNGVIGYGLNHVKDIERGLDACFTTLDQHGVLILGWNDNKRRMPLDIRAIHSLTQFHEYYFEPLQTCHFRTEASSRHTFSFYSKV